MPQSTPPGIDAVRLVAHADRGEPFLARLAGLPRFACVIGSTDTAEIPGISAAGATPEKRRYTAALDAEFLLTGRTLSLDEIPKNPLGPPSPVVITRAALALLGIEPLVVDAGTRIPPRVPHLLLGASPGRCITTGTALSLGPTFVHACRWTGRFVSEGAPWIILAESVPGGTTTALSVLQALGHHRARGKVSSSMPGGNHALKEEVVSRSLAAANLDATAGGLEIASAVGDPMQPALALMALEASLRVPVVLGGGTQMAAVAALALRLHREGQPGNPDNLAIATTRWVTEDESADLGGILEDLPHPVPAFAACMDFGPSSLDALRRYEDGLVKEGVGAGAAAFAVFLSATRSPGELLASIEEVVRALP